MFGHVFISQITLYFVNKKLYVVLFCHSTNQIILTILMLLP